MSKPISDKNERQAAYRLAVNLNKITNTTLRSLHKKNKNIIDKWLYVDDSYPDFQACFELERFIRALRGEMPIELARIIQRSKVRVNELIKSMDRNPLSEFKITGNRNQVGNKASVIFLYNGEKVSISQLSQKTGVNRMTLRSRIVVKHLYFDGADISDINVQKFKSKNKE